MAQLFGSSNSPVNQKTQRSSLAQTQQTLPADGLYSILEDGGEAIVKLITDLDGNQTALIGCYTKDRGYLGDFNYTAQEFSSDDSVL